MIDPNRLTAAHFDETAAALARRGFELQPEVVGIGEDRLAELRRVEALRAERNALSTQVRDLMGRQRREEAAPLIARSRELGPQISEAEAALGGLSDQFTDIALRIPNIPSDRTPDGLDESSNVVLEVVGRKPEFDFAPLDHADLGERLGIIDSGRGSKLAGARFNVLRGPGAELSQALINFMLDEAKANGYERVAVPYLVNEATMRGTGQLPKFADDMYRTGDGLYLIPTAEVPVTNLLAGETIPEAELPIRLTAYTECFRQEAGSAGRDTRGILRSHQFSKIELVQIVAPRASWDALAEMMRHSSGVLDKLGLHYQKVALAAGDISFAAAYTGDLEVWLPGQDRFREVSSVSNMTDFQARRMGIYVDVPGQPKELAHTLNGSALAVGRTMIAILEQCQQPDGSIRIPEALHPYLDFKTIKPRT